MRHLLSESLKGLLAVLVVFGVLEVGLRLAYAIRNAAVDSIPLPYVIGHDYGPVPPWVDGLRLLEADDELIWRNRPGVRRRYLDVFSPVETEEERTRLLRQFIPRVPGSLRDNPSWEIALNSQGFRDEELPAMKLPGELRIVCLGDSWTFGANVGQDESYPAQLETLLRERHPDRVISVFNLGVLGYSSFQGRRLLETRALDLEPDILLIGFGMNDANVAGYRDKDMPAYRSDPSPAQRVLDLVNGVEALKLLRYYAELVNHRPTSLGDRLRAAATSRPGAEHGTDYDELEPWVRVSLPDYASNLETMIDLVRTRGGSAVLLFNELWEDSPYRTAIRGVAERTEVAFVDACSLIAEARRRDEHAMERRFELTPERGDVSGGGVESSGDGVDVVFRVFAEPAAVEEAIYIVGNHDTLGDFQPNRVRMADDGTDGDQQAGDGVWSLQTTLPGGFEVAYVYTNSGRPGVWEGLDVPDIRRFRVSEEGSRVYRPIDRFGRIYMQADSWHTNARGYRMIAERLRERLDADPVFRAAVRRGDGAAEGAPF